MRRGKEKAAGGGRGEGKGMERGGFSALRAHQLRCVLCISPGGGVGGVG